MSKIESEVEKLLIENYQKYYRLAYSYLKNENDALDAVQETAYRAIKVCKKNTAAGISVNLDIPDCNECFH